MSEFARKQMQKYGWTDGKGLGKKENGITEAIKPFLKFNNHGIGHDSSKDFTSRWWDYAFNKAANSIKVLNTQDGVSIRKKRKKKSKKSSEVASAKIHKGFVKASDSLVEPVFENQETENDLQFCTMATDEELFKTCGGRTAHKAARFGLKMNGKLKRIQEQEDRFCKDSSIREQVLVQNCLFSCSTESLLDSARNRNVSQKVSVENDDTKRVKKKRKKNM